MSMNRREFVQSASVATVGLGLGSCSFADSVTQGDAVMKVLFRGLFVAVVDRPGGTGLPRESKRVDIAFVKAAHHEPTMIIPRDWFNPVEASDRTVGLARKEVRLLLNGTVVAGSTVTFGGPETITPPCPKTSEDWKSLAWLADLEKACKAVKLDAECLKPTQPAPDLQARMTITTGVLTSRPPGIVDVLRFTPAKEPAYEQAFAIGVEWELPISGGNYALSIVDLETGTAASPIAIVPKSTSAVEMKSVPSSLEKSANKSVAVDFDHYYRLTQNDAYDRPLPTFVRHCTEPPKEEAVGAEPGICIPGLAYHTF